MADLFVGGDSMPIYRGVSGVNREITQQWRGVNGINREIQEQYRGVDGINRLVFSAVKIKSLRKIEMSFPIITVDSDYSKITFESIQGSDSDSTCISGISILLDKPIPINKLNIYATIAWAYGSSGSSIQIRAGYQGRPTSGVTGGVKLTTQDNNNSITNYPIYASGSQFYSDFIDEIQILFRPESGRSKSIRGEIRNNEILINGKKINFNTIWSAATDDEWSSPWF